MNLARNCYTLRYLCGCIARGNIIEIADLDRWYINLHIDTIHHFIDSMVLELTDARLRNFERWDVIDTKIWPNFFVGQTYEDEIIFLKDWIELRLNWLDNNMIGSAANCATPPASFTADLIMSGYVW